MDLENAETSQKNHTITTIHHTEAVFGSFMITPMVFMTKVHTFIKSTYSLLMQQKQPWCSFKLMTKNICVDIIYDSQAKLRRHVYVCVCVFPHQENAR